MYKPNFQTYKSYGNGITCGLLLSVIFILSSIIFKDLYLVKSFSVFLSQVFLFTTFDVLGWHFIIQERSIDQESDWDVPIINIVVSKQKAILSYRIMQTMFQIVTLLFVLVYSNYQVMLVCIVFWWFLGCDLLYYFIAGIPLKADEKINWVSWSAWRLFSKSPELNRTQFILSAILGLIISVPGMIKYKQATKLTIK